MLGTVRAQSVFCFTASLETWSLQENRRRGRENREQGLQCQPRFSQPVGLAFPPSSPPAFPPHNHKPVTATGRHPGRHFSSISLLTVS